MLSTHVNPQMTVWARDCWKKEPNRTLSSLMSLLTKVTSNYHFIVDYCFNSAAMSLCLYWPIHTHIFLYHLHHGSLWHRILFLLHLIFFSRLNVLACVHGLCVTYCVGGGAWENRTFIELTELAIIFRQLVHNSHFKVQKWNDDYQIIDLFDGLCSVILSNNKRTNGSKGSLVLYEMSACSMDKAYIYHFYCCCRCCYCVSPLKILISSLSLLFSLLPSAPMPPLTSFHWLLALNSFVIRSLVCHSFAYLGSHTFISMLLVQ